MHIGILTLELYLPGITSLKNKRQIFESLKGRISNKFNVSIAEIDAQEKWQRGIVGVVNINNNTHHIEQVLREVIKFVEGNYHCQLIDHQIEFI